MSDTLTPLRGLVKAVGVFSEMARATPRNCLLVDLRTAVPCGFPWYSDRSYYLHRGADFGVAVGMIQSTAQRRRFATIRCAANEASRATRRHIALGRRTTENKNGQTSFMLWDGDNIIALGPGSDSMQLRVFSDAVTTVALNSATAGRCTSTPGQTPPPSSLPTLPPTSSRIIPTRASARRLPPEVSNKSGLLQCPILAHLPAESAASSRASPLGGRTTGNQRSKFVTAAGSNLAMKMRHRQRRVATVQVGKVAANRGIRASSERGDRLIGKTEADYPVEVAGESSLAGVSPVLKFPSVDGSTPAPPLSGS
jgi:hypothetical protein